mmetsp:Transcript_6043/g.11740  ORF Transcript_6043/g.11740 Transcript_6043/m.11740 type:complete len:200 (-) Transcript_6043:571-1170(-)
MERDSEPSRNVVLPHPDAKSVLGVGHRRCSDLGVTAARSVEPRHQVACRVLDLNRVVSLSLRLRHLPEDLDVEVVVPEVLPGVVLHDAHPREGVGELHRGQELAGLEADGVVSARDAWGHASLHAELVGLRGVDGRALVDQPRLVEGPRRPVADKQDQVLRVGVHRQRDHRAHRHRSRRRPHNGVDAVRSGDLERGAPL